MITAKAKTAGQYFKPPVGDLSKSKPLNEWIKINANDNDLTYLDYYNAMTDKQGFLKAEYSSGGLHPNSHGYKVMAGLAEQAITSTIDR